MQTKSYLFYFQSRWLRFGVRWPYGWRFPVVGEYVLVSFVFGLLLGILL
jgi:hypothetical protein